MHRNVAQKMTLLFGCVLVTGLLLGQVQKNQDNSSLDAFMTVHPGLHVPANPIPLRQLRRFNRLQHPRAWARFLKHKGRNWKVMIDERTGRPSLMEGKGIPMEDLAPADSVPAGLVGDDPYLNHAMAAISAFLERHPHLFDVDPNDLVMIPGASHSFENGHLIFVDLGFQPHGIPVRDAHIVFRFVAGKLVQMGAEGVGDAPVSRTPRLSPQEAVDILSGYTGVQMGSGDSLLAEPLLENLAFADGSTGLSYRLAWRIVMRREGEMGTWEAMVDADNGEVLSFKDANEYGNVHGGIYPSSPTTSTEVDRPLPYANVGSSYSDAAGNYTASGSVTTTLSGKYVRVSDSCGSISKTNSTGDINLGTSSGTDCTTPGTGGSGNTHAARSSYYHLNKIIFKARSYLPSNSWLQGQLRDNVNLNQTCNAYWNGSTVNFFKSGGGCSNTGEIAAIFLHEWGHGLDSNDGNGSSPDNGSGEAYGDTTAMMQTHSSCIGPGFLTSNCSGYGDNCTSCTGVRDVDYAKHSGGVSHTPSYCISRKCPSSSH